MNTFDAATHQYSAEGRRLPSVTGILRDCGLTGKFEFRDPIHAFRGTAVHEGAALIIAGGEPKLAPLPDKIEGMSAERYAEYAQVHSEIPGYWEAVRRAKAQIRFEGAIHECRLIDPVAGFAGTFDLGAWSATWKEQLWDIKSGTYPPMTVVQICAYEDLARNGVPLDPNHPGLDWLQAIVRSGKEFERCGLRLEKTGRFTAYYETTKNEPYSLPKWMAAWKSCLFLHRYVPDHRYTEDDGINPPRRKSRLSDLKWVADAIQQNLKEPVKSAAMRAGENLYNLRSSYGLL